MKEEKTKNITDNNKNAVAENSKVEDSEFQMPTLLNFDKNYDNKDLNIFKEDILNYLNERDKSIFTLIKTYKEKMEKTEKDYSELTKRINDNYLEVLSSQAQINNRLDKLNAFESFSMKANDQLISHEIRLNNLREEYNKSVQKYDKIYLDNLELPGYIGKYSKYKNCQVFFEDVIKEINKLNSYKEKNIIDLKAYKEKLEQIIKTFNTLVDNNNKSQIKYINEMNEKNNRDCKNLVDTLAEKIHDIRIENSTYAVELIGKSINLTKEWDKIQEIKEEITKDFNQKILEFKIVSNNTINSFYDYKNEFNLIKRKFFELAEFIKDVRFRKNLGGDVKKKEIKCITKKITGKKSCATIDKDKEKALLEFNYKFDKNEKNEKNDLRKSVSQEQASKVKNYIKGGAIVEEFKEDAKIQDLSEEKNYKKKTKIEYSKNIKNVAKEDSVVRRKYKSPTVFAGSSNLKKLNSLKKDNNNNPYFSDESDHNSLNNNSLNNPLQVNHTNTNMNTSIEKVGVKNTNNATNINSNNRYLIKDILIETDDKIINELASELEQTNNKINNKSKEKNQKIKNLIEKIEPVNINMNINELASEIEDSNHQNEKENNSKEKNDNIQTLLNKFEPMNINMNINKIENINLHNNDYRNTNKTIKSPKISKKSNNTFMTINDNSYNASVDKKIINFDKKLTNLELYTKEKIIDLIAQIENLRQLFLSTNKLTSFAVNPLFNFQNYSSSSTNILNQFQAQKIKEAHIVELGAKLLPPPGKITKRYISNSNNIITAKDKENINKDSFSSNIKNDINLPRDISSRIKTGKNPASIKTVINRTLGGNNTIIFSNMANDINSKFLKGVEKKSIIDGSMINKNNIENKSNNINKFIELNKITTNAATKTQINFKNEINLLAGDNTNLP